ncbi:sulfurtransferase TusA family protein [Streptomyces sp. NPDC015032]|uniref:sulfurtransferase TusA family protein n=1 Tax=Streptomyces sp. NPDC015032 TaxID=3364937 RepID=UPI0036F87724
MNDGDKELAEVQRQHWQNTYTAHPGMYGEETSTTAVPAAQVCPAAGAQDVRELGAGHGRDALYSPREDSTAEAADSSPTGLQQRRQAAQAQGTAERVTTAVHDVCEPLPLADASMDAVFAHMPRADLTIDGTGLLCVTLLLRLRKQIEGAPAGTVVHVTATDPAAPLDLPAWCHMVGHDYLGPVPGNPLVYAIRLAADALPTLADAPWHPAPTSRRD